jgi:hypothetical protein
MPHNLSHVKNGIVKREFIIVIRAKYKLVH